VVRQLRALNSPALDPAVWASNQGVYNLFLFAGLLWGILCPDRAFAFQLKLFFLSCIILAGLYAAFTVKRTFLYAQSLPAGIALLMAYLALG